MKIYYNSEEEETYRNTEPKDEVNDSFINSSNDEYIQMIIEQSDRLTSIVDKLLGPQKVETYEVINIHIIIEKVLQVLELDEQNNITFQRDYDPSLPNLKIQKESIQQVFFNILSNACHASKNIGKVIIKTRILHQFIVQDIQYKLTIQMHTYFAEITEE